MGITVAYVYIGLAAIWLIVLTGLSVRRIVKGTRITDAKSGTEEHYPIKNTFILFMIGYLTLEISSVEQEMMDDHVLLYLAFAVLSLLFAHIIGTRLAIQADLF